MKTRPRPNRSASRPSGTASSRKATLVPTYSRGNHGAAKAPRSCSDEVDEAVADRQQAQDARRRPAAGAVAGRAGGASGTRAGRGFAVRLPAPPRRPGFQVRDQQREHGDADDGEGQRDHKNGGVAVGHEQQDARTPAAGRPRRRWCRASGARRNAAPRFSGWADAAIIASRGAVRMPLPIRSAVTTAVRAPNPPANSRPIRATRTGRSRRRRPIWARPTRSAA